MARDDGRMASIPLACSSSGDLILSGPGSSAALLPRPCSRANARRSVSGFASKATHEVQLGLREFARWESGCCPFLDFTIRTAPDEDTICVDVSAPQVSRDTWRPPRGSAILDLLVALTDSRRT
jgi:hypothetical protein